VQGACKHLKTRLLLTQNTFEQLDDRLKARARRLCQVRVINIETPVTLYEMAEPDRTAIDDWKGQYESGLKHFEECNFRMSARTLQPLIVEQINDGPSIVMIARAIQGLANGTAPDHPVWELPTK
jgi:hypothetical protein